MAGRQAALGRARRREGIVPARPGRARSTPCSTPSSRRCRRARHGQRAVARFRPPARARTAISRSVPRASPMPCAPDSVRWVDVGTQLRLVESPLDIAESGCETAGVLKHERCAREPRTCQRPRLGLHLGHAGRRPAGCAGSPSPAAWTMPRCCGCRARSTMRAQAALYVPRAFPKPNDPAHSHAGCAAGCARRRRAGRPHAGADDHAARAAHHRRCHAAALRPDRGRTCGPRCWSQGELPKRVLMDRVSRGRGDGPRRLRAGGLGVVLGGLRCAGRRAATGGDRQAAIPAAATIRWSRHAPQRLEAPGAAAPSAITSLPEAAVALKQGAGRLIRRETDRGVLVICDTRLVAMGYGKRLLAALPPMRRIEGEADVRCRDRRAPAAQASAEQPGGLPELPPRVVLARKPLRQVLRSCG